MTIHSRRLAAAAAAVILAGCANTTGPEPTTSSAPTTPVNSSATPVSSSASSAAATTTPVQSPWHQANADQNSYSLAVKDLTRAGTMATLTLQLRVDQATTARPARLDLLADATDQTSTLSGLTNGIGLVDPDSQTLYMPATRTNKTSTALCSPAFPTTVKAGDQITITCLYASVPTSLKTVQVTTPRFGAFDNVAIH